MHDAILHKINSTTWATDNIHECAYLIERLSELRKRIYSISQGNSEKYTVHRFGTIDYLFVGSHGFQLNQDGSIVDLGDNKEKFATIYMYGNDDCHLYVTEDTEFVKRCEDIKNLTWACLPERNNGDDALFANINGEIIFLG
jgi:hypothetical protein